MRESQKPSTQGDIMLKKTLIAVVTLVGLGVVASLIASRYMDN